MKSRWISYQDTLIFNVNFSNLAQNRESLKTELEAITLVVMDQPKNSILALVDIRDTNLTPALVLLIRQYAWRLGGYIYRAAVIDNTINHFKMVVLNSIARVGGQEVVLFDDKEKAKNWLVKSSSSK